MTKEVRDKLNFVNEAIDQIVQDDQKKEILKKTFKQKFLQLKEMGSNSQALELLDRTIMKLLFSIFMANKKSHSDDELGQAIAAINKPAVQSQIRTALDKQKQFDAQLSAIQRLKQLEFKKDPQYDYEGSDLKIVETAILNAKKSNDFTFDLRNVYGQTYPDLVTGIYSEISNPTQLEIQVPKSGIERAEQVRQAEQLKQGQMMEERQKEFSKGRKQAAFMKGEQMVEERKQKTKRKYQKAVIQGLKEETEASKLRKKYAVLALVTQNIEKSVTNQEALNALNVVMQEKVDDLSSQKEFEEMSTEQATQLVSEEMKEPINIAIDELNKNPSMKQQTLEEILRIKEKPKRLGSFEEEKEPRPQFPLEGERVISGTSQTKQTRGKSSKPKEVKMSKKDKIAQAKEQFLGQFPKNINAYGTENGKRLSEIVAIVEGRLGDKDDPELLTEVMKGGIIERLEKMKPEEGSLSADIEGFKEDLLKYIDDITERPKESKKKKTK